MNAPEGIDLPADFLQRLEKQLGSDTVDSYLESLKGPTPVSLRLNPEKIGKLPFERGEKIPWHPYGYFLDKRPLFVFDPHFHGGSYYVQEASSMLLYHFVDFDREQLILDACAAPGGKSTLLAQAMAPGSLLVSNEVVRSRVGVLAENMSKWGNPDVWVTQADPRQFSALGPRFDTVVIDAPCSGEGLFRKDASSRDQWSVEAVATCSARQKRIIADILPSLKPGGKLIYSTCTYAPQENEENIQWMLDSFSKELELDPVEGLERYGAIPIEIKGRDGAAWRCIPPRFKGEGFFISRLQKTTAVQSSTYSPVNRTNKGTPKARPLPKEVKGFIDRYIDPRFQSFCRVEGEVLMYSPLVSGYFTDLAKLPFAQKGIRLGKLRRKEVTPTQELALSNLMRRDLTPIELNLEQALFYLRKNDLAGIDSENGWRLVSYQGVNLGWIKVIKGKGKNQYPINWRIRRSQ